MENNLTVIDIGANRGEFLRHVLNSDPNVRVIAAEPNKVLFMHPLEHLKTLNYERLQIEYKALSNESGKGILFGHNLMNGQLASLLPINAEAEGWKIQTSFVDFKLSENMEIEKISVQEFISKFKLKNIDFLKIDTQGTDLLILKEFLIHSSVKAGVVEVSIEASDSRYYSSLSNINSFISILREFGFLITRIIPNNSQVDEFNIFFAKSYEDHKIIYTKLDLRNNPSLSRYSKIQDLYNGSNIGNYRLIKKLFKKLFMGITHPISSTKSVLIKITT